eukprot:TRINITY_DN3969_c0_g1_i5.p1 TRINITY_DN3969_c0_g1~~TRINITY_DN3969_c0_g1_i5.p1  ORF type:complete len:580 (-),score=90.97 TRINITY_DN3969_c0_g1_i5:66-1805(-)
MCIRDRYQRRVHGNPKIPHNSNLHQKKFKRTQLSKTIHNKKNLYNEISVMRQLINLKNANVINLQEVIQSNKHYYIIMEYCKDGDLEKHLERNPETSEQEAIEILQQLMNGFKALHEISVVHRDIKPQNIFINRGVFKLGDFGFSRQSTNEGKIQVSHQMYGTPAFMAPELMSYNISAYNSKVDIWSLGVLMFYIMFRKYPFDMTQSKKLIQIFMFKVDGGHQNLNFSPAFSQFTKFLEEKIKEKRISSEFSDLLQKMLSLNPLERISFVDLYQHKIFTKEEVFDASKSRIPKTSCFYKYKLEAEKLYPSIEQKEKEQLQQQIKYGQTLGIANTPINNNGKQEEYIKQQLANLQEKYENYKTIKLFLQFIYMELIQISTKVNTLFSNSAIYSIITYLYLKINKVFQTLENKQNFFDFPAFEDFIVFVNYQNVLASYKSDLTEVERARQIIKQKVEKQFNQQDLIRIDNIKEPTEFTQAYTLKMIKFAQQIKNNYLNNNFELSQDQSELRKQVLKLSFFIACGSLIDYPEQWNIIAVEAKNEPGVLKYLAETKSENSMIRDIDNACQLADQLLKKKLQVR